MPDGDTTAAPAAAGAAPPPPPVLVSSDPLSPEFGFVRTWLPRYGNGLVAARGFSAGEVCIAEVPMLATEETPAVADDVWEANQRFGIMAQVEGKDASLDFSLQLLQYCRAPEHVRGRVQALFAPSVAEWGREPFVVAAQEHAAMVAAAVAADPEGFRNSVLGPCAACGVEEAVQALLVWICNSYAYQDGTCALLEWGSLVNHCCSGNTRYRLDHTVTPTRCLFVAVRDIEPGDVLTVSYLGWDENTMMSTRMRREVLRRTKLFYCDCPRCTLEPDYYRPLPCPVCCPPADAVDTSEAMDAGHGAGAGVEVGGLDCGAGGSGVQRMGEECVAGRGDGPVGSSGGDSGGDGTRGGRGGGSGGVWKQGAAEALALARHSDAGAWGAGQGFVVRVGVGGGRAARLAGPLEGVAEEGGEEAGAAAALPWVCDCCGGRFGDEEVRLNVGERAAALAQAASRRGMLRAVEAAAVGAEAAAAVREDCGAAGGGQPVVAADAEVSGRTGACAALGQCGVSVGGGGCLTVAGLSSPPAEGGAAAESGPGGKGSDADLDSRLETAAAAAAAAAGAPAEATASAAGSGSDCAPVSAAAPVDPELDLEQQVYHVSEQINAFGRRLDVGEVLGLEARARTVLGNRHWATNCLRYAIVEIATQHLDRASWWRPDEAASCSSAGSGRSGRSRASARSRRSTGGHGGDGKLRPASRLGVHGAAAGIGSNAMEPGHAAGSAAAPLVGTGSSTAGAAADATPTAPTAIADAATAAAVEPSGGCTSSLGAASGGCVSGSAAGRDDAGQPPPAPGHGPASGSAPGSGSGPAAGHPHHQGEHRLEARSSAAVGGCGDQGPALQVAGQSPAPVSVAAGGDLVDGDLDGGQDQDQDRDQHGGGSDGGSDGGVGDDEADEDGEEDQWTPMAAGTSAALIERHLAALWGWLDRHTPDEPAIVLKAAAGPACTALLDAVETGVLSDASDVRRALAAAATFSGRLSRAYEAQPFYDVSGREHSAARMVEERCAELMAPAQTKA